MVMITWDGTHRTHRMLCRTICSSMYMVLHIHTPRPAERERNEGSLEAMVSMEHAARWKGDRGAGTELAWELPKRGMLIFYNPVRFGYKHQT